MRTFSKEILKKRIIHDLQLFLFNFIFLTLFLWTFTMYRRLILEEYQVSYIHYSYNFIEALILAKIILVGQTFKLGERFSDQPLLIPTLYKTLIFSFFIGAFTVLEEFFIGYFHGKDVFYVYHKLVNLGFYEIIARVLVMFFVFIFFFAFLEIGRSLGEGTLIRLFTHKRSTHKLK